MTLKIRYQAAKARLLADSGVCPENRQLFRRFLEFEEYKLKRLNGLAELDDSSYKTVLAYVSRLRTVNRWFDNKPWIALTKQDIQRVYDDVEDGEIRTISGKPFRARELFYRKIMRGKPFDMAGKKQLAREVMEFAGKGDRTEVRFIREATFRELVEVVIKPEHKALLWLAWDVGENVGSLLQLRRRDLRREVNAETNEPEYYVNLRREILKRSRTPRTEVTNYQEAVASLDLILRPLPEQALLFNFGHRMAAKVLARAVRITAAKCVPNGEPVTLKDLRSSMCCDLLSKGWTTDEVNARLGHRPSSRELDRYVNFLALNRHRPKRKFHDGQVATLNKELSEIRSRESLLQQRHRSLQGQIEELREQVEQNNRLMYREVVRLIQRCQLDEVDAA